MSQIAEVTIGLKGGGVLHASERSDDMYTSIDLVAHKVAKALRKHHEKVVGKVKKPFRGVGESEKEQLSSELEFELESPDFDEEELLVDLDEKYKTEEAVSCLAFHFGILG